jgi:hypothetical protein
MTQPNPPPVVAIFNSTDEILDMVRLAFEAHGFVTATARLADIQSGALDLIAFVKEHMPSAPVPAHMPPPCPDGRPAPALIADCAITLKIRSGR